MTTALANAILSARTSLERLAGESVTVSRGGEQVELTAIRLRYQSLSEGDHPSASEARMTDWSVRAADYVLSGAVTLPVAGDRLDDGQSVYEVVAPPGRMVYEAEGTDRLFLRIHTRRVGDA